MNLETVLQSEACLKMWHPVLQNCNLMGNTQNNFLKEKWLQKFKVGTEAIWYIKLRESSFHTSCNLKLVRFDRLLPAKTEEEKKNTQKLTKTRPVISDIFLSVSAYSPEWLVKHNLPEGLSYAWQIRDDMALLIYSWSMNSLSYLHSCLLDFIFVLAFQMWNNINAYRTWKYPYNQHFHYPQKL